MILTRFTLIWVYQWDYLPLDRARWDVVYHTNETFMGSMGVYWRLL